MSIFAGGLGQLKERCWQIEDLAALDFQAVVPPAGMGLRRYVNVVRPTALADGGLQRNRAWSGMVGAEVLRARTAGPLTSFRLACATLRAGGSTAERASKNLECIVK